MSKTTILYRDVAPGAEADAEIAAAPATSFSEPDRLASGGSSVPCASCERNRWLLNGSFALIDSAEIAFWSANLSGGSGAFDSPPVITITFDQQYSSVGITLVFDSAGDFCSAVHIAWYQAGVQKAEADFAPDAAVFFCQRQVESYDEVKITLNRTNIPGRRAKLEQIVFGIYRTFGMSELRSASVVNEMSLAALELPVSTLNWTLDSRSDVGFMFQLKQPVEVQNNQSPIGVYYIDSYARISKTVYQIACCDAFGVLDELPFSGGVYTAKSAKALLAEITGGVFPVDYDAGLADTALTGVLEPGSVRTALQQVLFAWGACAATDGGDAIRVFPLPAVPAEVGAGRTYTGVSVETASVVTKVTVTAHTYAQSDSGSIEINGVRYSDTKTPYSVSNPNITAADKQNVIEITGATLVSPEIGPAVAQRVYDYYLKRNTNKAKIVWAGERLGDLLTLPNAWGGTNTGHLAKMEIRLSNTVAAACETIGGTP